MAQAGKVSVIIPSYNYGRFLGFAVESVRAQSYSNWEAIIVDDGSSDNTQEIAAGLVALDPGRIFYHRIPNGGVANARNVAVSHATGEFILPLDADDELVPDAIRLLVGGIQRHSKIGVAYGAVTFIDTVPGEPTLWIPGVESPKVLPYQNFIPISSLWRRELWVLGVRYREMFFEDWELWIQIIGKGYEPYYVPQFVLRYRRHMSGRDQRNRFFYFQAIAEQAHTNPTQYPEQFSALSRDIRATAPECYKKQTIVFLPHPESSEFTNFSGPLSQLAADFRQSGHTTVAMGNYGFGNVSGPGLFSLETPKEDLYNNIVFNLGRVGAELILFSELDSIFSHRAKLVENVQLVVTLAGGEDRYTDFSLSRSGEKFLLSSGGVAAGAQHSADLLNLEQVKERLVSAASTHYREKNEQAQSLRQKSHNLAQRLTGQWLGPESSVTVIVPTQNVDVARLERCLSSIRAAESAERTPILISDFGSAKSYLEDTKALCERYGAQFVTSKVRGAWSRSRALNAAIRQCKTEWVLMTDADMIFHPGLVEMWREYRHEFGDSFMYLAQCKKLPPIGDLPLPWEVRYYQSTSNRGRLFETYGQGGCQIVRTDWLRAVRGFNEAYTVWGMEDNDLSWRAELDGLKPIWMRPGMLLHQWHIKAVSSAARDRNREAFLNLIRSPKLIVNGESWGTASPEEEREYDLHGPAEFVPSGEYSVAQELEAAILKASTQAEQVQLLVRWGNHALSNNQDETALETFEDALTLAPTDLQVVLGLAATLIVKQNFTLASHYAQQVLEGDPTNHAARQIVDHILNRSL